MRIFMLVQREGIRGPVPKLTSHLIAALDSLGSTVVTHPWGRRSDSEHVWATLHQRLGDVLSVRRAMQGREFDVAIVNTAHDWRTLLRDIAVVLVIRRRCRPVILELHGSQASSLVTSGGHVFKLATALLLRMVDGILVLSSEEQRQVRAFRPQTAVFVVKNPYVRASFPVQGDGSDSPGLRPKLLFVGRLLREKGIFDLIEAMPHVLEEAECNLVVVGDGERERELRDRIQLLGLEETVSMTGYLVGDDLAREYARATVFVLPSWSEGFPTVLAEAMDAGLPIVTTRIRGAVDHLVDGEHALFVEPRDVDALASALVALLRNSGLRARMAEANRERIELFDPLVVAAEYLQVLQSLVRERGGHPHSPLASGFRSEV